MKFWLTVMVQVYIAVVQPEWFARLLRIAESF